MRLPPVAVHVGNSLVWTIACDHGAHKPPDQHPKVGRWCTVPFPTLPGQGVVPGGSEMSAATRCCRTGLPGSLEPCTTTAATAASPYLCDGTAEQTGRGGLVKKRLHRRIH